MYNRDFENIQRIHDTPIKTPKKTPYKRQLQEISTPPKAPKVPKIGPQQLIDAEYNKVQELNEMKGELEALKALRIDIETRIGETNDPKQLRLLKNKELSTITQIVSLRQLMFKMNSQLNKNVSDVTTSKSGKLITKQYASAVAKFRSISITEKQKFSTWARNWRYLVNDLPNVDDDEMLKLTRTKLDEPLACLFDEAILKYKQAVTIEENDVVEKNKEHTCVMDFETIFAVFQTSVLRSIGAAHLEQSLRKINYSESCDIATHTKNFTSTLEDLHLADNGAVSEKISIRVFMKSLPPEWVDKCIRETEFESLDQAIDWARAQEKTSRLQKAYQSTKGDKDEIVGIIDSQEDLRQTIEQQAQSIMTLQSEINKIYKSSRESSTDEKFPSQRRIECSFCKHIHNLDKDGNKLPFDKRPQPPNPSVYKGHVVSSCTKKEQDARWKKTRSWCGMCWTFSHPYSQCTKAKTLNRKGGYRGNQAQPPNSRS